MYNVTVDDEGKYHYWFVVDDEVPDTGVRYEIDLKVLGKFFLIKIPDVKFIFK